MGISVHHVHGRTGWSRFAQLRERRQGGRD